MFEKCKVCKRTNCYEHCQVADNGKHEADPRSARQVEGVDFTLDYTCKYCGQSGSVIINPITIYWD
jgi:hypothetical protein